MRNRLNSGGKMGAASILSRKEAARKALMSMELPDKIKRMQNQDLIDE